MTVYLEQNQEEIKMEENGLPIDDLDGVDGEYVVLNNPILEIPSETKSFSKRPLFVERGFFYAVRAVLVLLGDCPDRNQTPPKYYRIARNDLIDEKKLNLAAIKEGSTIVFKEGQVVAIK